MEDQIVPCHSLWGQICVGFIYSFSHNCFQLQAKGIRLAMATSTQNCCKLLTSVEMPQVDTYNNVLPEFPSPLRYRETDILTDGVDKMFCLFSFFSVWLISGKLSNSYESFSVDILSISSMVGGKAFLSKICML